jgi:hypothetical protein
MFYARINRIKVFDNREDFLGLFNKRAGIRFLSYQDMTLLESPNKSE